MAQFDVYKNENNLTNQKVPYLLDIQNDILDSINTRVVIPLVKDKNDFKGLTKEFVIENQKEEIKNSIDFLIYGF